MVEDKTYPDFTGKIVWFEIAGSSDPRGGILLEFIEYRSLGGRQFIVGRMPDWDVSGWLAGADAGVAWDAVISYTAFKSREEYQERAARHKPGFRSKFFG